MEAREKAKELVFKYQYLVNTWDCYNDETLEIEYRLPNMKLCALIAIDLAIECNDFHLNYLEDVKQEIQNL